MFDLIIRRGTIIDGSGRPGFRADVGINGDRISAIGELGVAAERIIEADGLIVAPGFIDIHAHTDELALINPSFESKVTQGVTTEVSGNCGCSSAPLGGLRSECGDDEAMLAECGIERDWRTMAEFLARLDRCPLAINFATFVGHGDVRAVAMGYEARTPTSAELDGMCRLVAQSIDEGAFGLSSGLIYPPGCYSETGELIELARVAAQHGGIYATHMRSESDRLLGAVEEAIEIGRSSGIQVQISHHKACGVKNWGRVKESLALIDDARNEGVEVWADQYPYTATSTTLGAMLPDWAHEGGRAALLARLADPEQRMRLRSELLKSTLDGSIADSGGWGVTVIGSIVTEHNRRFEGLNVVQIAELTGKHPVDTVLDLLREEEGNVGMMRFVISEDDVKTVMRHPAVVFGSDAAARSNSGPLNLGKPHPRAYGTFPRVLGKYVREDSVLSLEEAVAKMTGRTAEILSLRERGLLRENYFADIVVFDRAEIEDAATFANPHSYARGIKQVLVNGRVVVEGGSLSERACGAGNVLRKN